MANLKEFVLSFLFCLLLQCAPSLQDCSRPNPGSNVIIDPDQANYTPWTYAQFSCPTGYLASNGATYSYCYSGSPDYWSPAMSQVISCTIDTSVTTPETGNMTAESMVFVADNSRGAIYMADFSSDSLDSLNFDALPFGSVSQPIGVDYDPDTRMVYWTETSGSIRRANIDGTMQSVIVNSSIVGRSENLALDTSRGKVFWTDETLDRIMSANLDGSSQQILINTDLESPRAIIVHQVEGVMIWTDWSAPSRIERANLDGGDRYVIVNSSIIYPNGLALNADGTRVYWCDAGTDKIESVDLWGNDRMVHLATSSIHPYDLAVVDDTIIWTDWIYDAIGVTSTSNGSGYSFYYHSTFQNPHGIHVYQEEMPTTTEVYNPTTYQSEPEPTTQDNLTPQPTWWWWNTDQPTTEDNRTPQPTRWWWNTDQPTTEDNRTPQPTRWWWNTDQPTTEDNGTPRPTWWWWSTHQPTPDGPDPTTGWWDTTGEMPYAGEENVTLVVGVTQTISSPNYPSYYTNNVRYNWYITAPSDYEVLVQFLDFDLENYWDFLTIGIGESPSSPGSVQLAQLSGSSLPPDMRLDASKSWMLFTTDSSVTKRGFQLQLSLFNSTTEPVTDDPWVPPTTLWWNTDQPTTEDNTTPPSTRWWWNTDQPTTEDNRTPQPTWWWWSTHQPTPDGPDPTTAGWWDTTRDLPVTGGDFCQGCCNCGNMGGCYCDSACQQLGDCCHDYVQFCGNASTTPDYNTHQPTTEDNRTPRPTWWWSTIQPTPDVPDPTTTGWWDSTTGWWDMPFVGEENVTLVVGITQTMSSPNYPSNYPNNVRYHWYITAPSGYDVLVQFMAFELESDYDYLRIGIGESPLSPGSVQLAKLSGSSLPPDMRLDASKSWMLFTTDSSVTERGFQLQLSLSNSNTDYTTSLMPTEAPSTVRLVNGSEAHEGRVEVFYSGSWGTVCDDSWGITDARVVCRSLGYQDALSAPSQAHFGQGSGPIWMDDVQCSGNEAHIFDCPHNGFGSHNCVHGEDASVVCLPEEADLTCDSVSMTLIMDRTLLEISDDARDVHFKDESCVGYDHDSQHVAITTMYDRCGTTQEQDDDYIIFTNMVTFYKPRPENGTNELITREHYIHIPVTCYLERTQVLEESFLPKGDLYVPGEKGYGEFSLNLDRYTNSGFYQPANDSGEVTLGTPLYFGVRLTSVANLTLLIESCWATSSPNPRDDHRYDIIENGCAVDSTTVIYNWASSTFKRFSIDAFTFIGDYDKVYVHCSILICDNNDSGTRCAQGCLARARRSLQSTGSRSKPHTITNGPLSDASRSQRDMLLDSVDDGPESHDSLMIVAVSALCVLIALTVIMVLLLVRTRRPRPEQIGYRRVGVTEQD
eukprot:XP_011664694.1 PREDICTED: deleted in malignant brain tumors 1 protein [Strongylocentrotus purpuratus]